MTKKQNKTPIDFGKVVREALEMFTLQEQQELLNLFLNDGIQDCYRQLEDIYCYQQPDYAQEAKPIAPFLKRLWDMKNYEDYIIEELQMDCASVPVDELEKEVRNFILNLFINFKENAEDEEDKILKLLYIYWIMEHYQMESSLEIVLEIMRQSPTFLSYCCSIPDNITPIILYQLGKNQLPVLLDFIKEPQTLFIGKENICSAIAQIAISSPERRLEVTKWFCQVLNYYYDHLDDAEKNNVSIIDYIAHLLKNIRAVETLPILEKIYKRYEIPTILVKGGIKELKKEMPHAEQSESLDFETIEDLIDVVYNDEWDDENFDEDFDDEFDEDFDDEFDDEDSFYIETITPKKLKLKITLTDSSPEVWRTLEVPSNIRLESFAEVIEVAMGWEGYHLHLFRKGKNIYLPDYEKDDNFLREDKIEKSSSATSLGEVLPKKGSRIEYEYDFGDSWMHTITLESQEAYKKDDIRSIILIDGANACPPEDCGGIWGYRRILEALEHPRTKAAREYREWLGKDFNPQKFNIKKTKIEMNDFPIAISE